jgi:hypothetical protein
MPWLPELFNDLRARVTRDFVMRPSRQRLSLWTKKQERQAQRAEADPAHSSGAWQEEQAAEGSPRS